MNMKEVIEHLRKLGHNRILPYNTQLGVCYELNFRFKFRLDKLNPAVGIKYQGWPLYSGDPQFPVPHPTMQDPEKAYVYDRELWEDNEYGNSRRAFCLWLADELEKHL